MPLGKPPFIHPEDLPAMQNYAAELVTEPSTNFRQFLVSKRFGDLSDHRFHFSLLPIPYLGDLNRADIFILQLNPGFNLVNYYAEWNVPAFRRRVEHSLREELDGVEFPFYSLDPELCWYSGYRWWEGKHRDIAATIANRKYKGRYLDALRELSQLIAVIRIGALSFDCLQRASASSSVAIDGAGQRSGAVRSREKSVVRPIQTAKFSTLSSILIPDVSDANLRNGRDSLTRLRSGHWRVDSFALLPN